MSEAKSSYAAADIRYVPAFQPEAVPSRLRLALAAADVVWNPDPERLTVLDIGCGRGVTVCALAAANPGWDVIGLDLQPAHIAEAREMAAEAGLDNARFIEADISELDAAAVARLLPDIDVAICYGVWTWVPDIVRQGIVTLLRARLKPGGIVMMGYNSLPGFSDTIVLQRILADAARGLTGNETERGLAVLDVLEKLREAGAQFLPPAPVLDRILRSCRRAPAYLAHEYFTGFWRPVYHADLARDLAPARLDFGAPASIAMSLPDLSLSPQHRNTPAAMPAWMDRDLLTDLFMTRRFRADIFVRGRRPGGRAMLPAMRFALLADAQEVKIEMVTQAGRANLPPGTERALLDALGEGPKSLAQLAALPEAQGLTPLDLAALLFESGVAYPLWRDVSSDPVAQGRAARCNAVQRRRMAREASLSGSALGLVIPALGGALPHSASDLATVVALQAGIPPDADALTERLVDQDEDEEARGRAHLAIETLLRNYLSAWRGFGIL